MENSSIDKLEKAISEMAIASIKAVSALSKENQELREQLNGKQNTDQPDKGPASEKDIDEAMKHIRI
ncbi:hypothetical protein [Mucilaginibacter paludis]|uniref:Uncharacterized protein n=1 Tax=Mucilaginibacter paludis DSM 18603 TaxID=714943 RepID=H1Y7C0_9SPHI|nr:hypothetical protein [Mucilaginibacter paludis]EHQ29007.1 hypothetical protein Mucpa_4923 [Mucilaginibacter paludis DSM 18603]